MILLDTHAILWLVLKPQRLSRPAARRIRRAEKGGGVAIASITLWEIALLAEEGRVRVHGSTEMFLEELSDRRGLNTLEISPEIAALAFRFPPGFPGDPADRIIGATARAHGIPLVTKDENLQDCPLLDTVW